jgi:hypothetical protein
MANGAGWRPDPDPALDGDVDGDGDGDVDPERSRQERYWDGSLWTDRVRPAGSAGPADRAADHAPQLHRAMSAAADDLDAVDDQISSLFDRTEGERPRPVTTDDDSSGNHKEEGAAVTVDRRDVISEYEQRIGGQRTRGQLDGGAFADLDAELAAEGPDQPEKAKRRMFHRRAKGTTAAPR